MHGSAANGNRRGVQVAGVQSIERSAGGGHVHDGIHGPHFVKMHFLRLATMGFALGLGEFLESGFRPSQGTRSQPSAAQ